MREEKEVTVWNARAYIAQCQRKGSAARSTETSEQPRGSRSGACSLVASTAPWLWRQGARTNGHRPRTSVECDALPSRVCLRLQRRAERERTPIAKHRDGRNDDGACTSVHKRRSELPTLHNNTRTVVHCWGHRLNMMRTRTTTTSTITKSDPIALDPGSHCISSQNAPKKKQQSCLH